MTTKRIFITGVGRGLGRELAAQLVAEGHEVWGSTRNGESDLDLSGCVALELSDESAIVNGVGNIGLDAIDLLINCAGIDSRATGSDPERRGPFDTDGETLAAVIAVNVTAPMVLTRELLPKLRAGTDPIVLNISSQLGSMEVGKTLGVDTPYNISKAALNMLVRNYAIECGRTNKKSICIGLHPGTVETGLSEPFQANVPDGQLFSPAQSAGHLLDVVDALTPDDSGKLFDWAGKLIQP